MDGRPGDSSLGLEAASLRVEHVLQFIESVEINTKKWRQATGVTEWSCQELVAFQRLSGPLFDEIKVNLPHLCVVPLLGPQPHFSSQYLQPHAGLGSRASSLTMQSI